MPSDERLLDGAVSATVHLYKVENGQRSEIATEISEGRDGFKRVRATQPLAAGSSLLLESVEPVCTGISMTPAMVTVGASSPTPTQLGTLKVGEAQSATTMTLPTSRGSCTADFEVANVKLELALDATAQPFADLMQHALLVDGKLRPQPQPVSPEGAWPWFALDGGTLEDVLYTLCNKPSDAWTNDVAAGSHKVQWLATLPDGSQLRSDEVTINLQCAGGADPGTPEQRTDAPAGGADLPAPEANTSADDSNAKSSGDTSQAADGDGCSLAARSSRDVPFAWLIGLGLLLVRRKLRNLPAVLQLHSRARQN